MPAPEAALAEARSGREAPQDTLELHLTYIWEQILVVRPIRVQDNFFELGGHSLLAVRLFAQIEKLCQKRLPLATLFEAPTVRQFANVLRQEAWVAPWSALVALQPGGVNSPLFCVYAHGGEVLFYRALAQELGPAQPFYALQAAWPPTVLARMLFLVMKAPCFIPHTCRVGTARWRAVF